MKTKIVRLDFSHPRNSEYPQVFNHVVRTIGKHQPLNLYLDNVFIQLKAHLPIIEKITARDLVSALSNFINIVELYCIESKCRLYAIDTGTEYPFRPLQNRLESQGCPPEQR